jgi:hypothetical protein
MRDLPENLEKLIGKCQADRSNFHVQRVNMVHVAAELGDYEEGAHTPALISEFRFVPNQNEEFEIDVLEAYKKLRYEKSSRYSRKTSRRN